MPESSAAPTPTAGDAIRGSRTFYRGKGNPTLRLLWNRLQAKLHHAYPCRKCGYAYNCPDGECHS